MKRIRLLLIAGFLMMPGIALTEEANAPELDQLHQDYTQSLNRAIAPVEEHYRRDLDSLARRYNRQGRTDEALAVKKEIASLDFAAAWGHFIDGREFFTRELEYSDPKANYTTSVVFQPTGEFRRGDRAFGTWLIVDNKLELTYIETPSSPYKMVFDLTSFRDSAIGGLIRSGPFAGNHIFLKRK